MKFTIQNHTLIAVLKHLLPICPKNPVMPVLENIKLHFDADTLYMTGTDLEVTLTMPVIGAYDIEQDAVPCLLPAHKLATLLTALTNNLPVTFEIKDNKAVISQGRGQYSFPVESSDVFPDDGMLVIKSAVNCSLPLSVLRAGIEATLYAAGKDMLRPAMTGVYCNISPGGVYFAATDAHKLSLFETQFTTPVPMPVTLDFVMPVKTAAALLQLEGDAAQQVQLWVGGGTLCVDFCDIKISSNLCEGRFPDVKAVIPADNHISVVVSQPDLIKAVKRACIFAGKSTFEITLKTEGSDKLSITAQDADTGNYSSETIECDTINGDIEICFNGKLLSECLSANNHTPELCLQLSQPHRAAIMTDARQKPDEKTITLLMPIMKST